MDRKSHWEQVYEHKAPTDVSWYQPRLNRSLALIDQLDLNPDATILDIGGGASTLVDDLLERGFRDMTVVDLSGKALDASRNRLGKRACSVKWIEDDVTGLDLPPESIDLWHDRAVFHFLTDPRDRLSYRCLLARVLKPGGRAILATFGPEGPQSCSGLDVVRYSPETLAAELGAGFRLIEAQTEDHETPWGKKQQFLYALFRNLGEPPIRGAGAGAAGAQARNGV